MNDNDLLINCAQIDLFQAIQEHRLNVNIQQIQRALSFAIEAHHGQVRVSGEPYILHSIAVAKLVIELKLDTNAIVLALLHDVVEDTKYTNEHILIHFGTKIADLVNGLTKLKKIETITENIKQTANLRKLLLAVSKDIVVLLVKLADRIHNMRTLHYIPNADKRARIAKETMFIYAPIAEQIGLQKFKTELQELSFAELQPDIRSSVINRLKYLSERGKISIENNIFEIQHLLSANNIKAKVSGREKSPYSIWKKMQAKFISFEQLSDILAFRILVHNIPDCYAALGFVHTKYHCIPGMFHDYISTIKSNGYRSLHTVVMGAENYAIEIQIRTFEMHEVAELGIAAHWAYKQSVSYDFTNTTQYDSIVKFRQILDSTPNPEEFIENTAFEMSCNQVFCFTPKGELIALQRGAKPIDFGFAIHSDIGLSCCGAKINGKTVSLNTILENGDQVEILRSNIDNTISSSMLNLRDLYDLAVTSKAKAEINKFIKINQREEHIKLGRSMIIQLFSKIESQYREEDLTIITNQFKKRTIEDLLESVGKGEIKSKNVVKFIHPEKYKFKNQLMTLINKTDSFKKMQEIIILQPKEIIQKITYKIAIGKNKRNVIKKQIQILKNKDYKFKKIENNFIIDSKSIHYNKANYIDAGGMNHTQHKSEFQMNDNIINEMHKVRIADCCNPIPGDFIVGITQSPSVDLNTKIKLNTISNEKILDKVPYVADSIIVHSTDCYSVTKLQKCDKSIVEMLWNGDGNTLYKSKIQIIMINDMRSSNILIATIIHYGISINDMKIVTKSKETVEIILVLKLKGLYQLQNIMKSINNLSCVAMVKRFKNKPTIIMK